MKDRMKTFNTSTEYINWLRTEGSHKVSFRRKKCREQGR